MSKPLCSRSRFTPACAASAAALVMLVWTVPCRADACRLELSDLADFADAPAWREAARALTALQLDARDCALIRLEALASGQTGACLIFVTHDARRAERELVAPRELLPTVEALRVTVPEPIPEPSKLPAPSRARPARLRQQGADALASEPEPVQDTGPSPILAVLSGTRGGADALFSPVLGAVASLLLSRWELGVTAAFEMQYFDLSAPDSIDRESSALAFGVMAGRREPLDRVALFYGARLSAVVLLHDYQDRGRGEGRMGAYLGIALPRRADLRFRAELGADLVGASRSFSEETAVGASSGAIAPEWALSALLGIELGGP